MTEKRKLKINWIFASTGLSGGVKSNRLIAEAMLRRGHDVCLYYSCASPPMPRLWNIRLFPAWFRKYRKYHFLRTNHHLVGSAVPVVAVTDRPIPYSKVRDADVTIATWWETAEWTADWPASKGKKAYFIRHYELHGGDTERVKATYKLPGQKLVIAKWLKTLMAEEFSDANATLVPNGVDRQQFHAVARGKNNPPTVGMLYGDQAWKGAKTAFAAIKTLQKLDPGIKVISFGTTAPRRDGELPDNFQFSLAPDQSEISKIYSQADCWIVPSVSEGFGMPGIEAAACRCPLVVTRCGGPEDYVCEGWNGFLVPVNDPASMASRVREILSLPDEQWRAMSQASYEMSLRFDWDHSARILEQALLEL